MTDTLQCCNNWRLLAKCKLDKIPTIVFFPLHENISQCTYHCAKNDICGGSSAKKICSECSVLAECREDAIQSRVPEGIFGGLSAKERRKILRQRRKMSVQPRYVWKDENGQTRPN